jgi:soluble lytic murein transglycosylase-like protein
MQVQVIQRMAQDNPGRAMDYYERHKGDVSGADHAKVNAMITGVGKMREAGQYVEEFAGGGKAGEIVRAVIGAESSGDAGAVSPVGAAGLMQLMPDTAREVAATLPGLGSRIAGMDDDALAAYWQTPQGKKDNVRLGTTYLNKQLVKYNGDLEAALVAYNAGPANATKWLDAGRDYSALPKSEETLPYVKKIFASLGYSIGGDTSADIQEATKGGTYFKGDPDAFLATKLAAGRPASYITDMKPALKNRLAGMINDAPDFVKAGLNIYSGARSNERQAVLWAAALKKYGSAAAARKWVAPPAGEVIDGKVSKGSQHGHGNAADLGWKDGSLANAPANVVAWVHANAGKYGLAFPLSNENWHIETIEARKGGAAKGDRTLDPATRRVGQAFDNQGDVDVVEGRGRIELAPDTANPADIYTKNAAPFTIQPDATSLPDWLQSARDTLSDNPSLLAEVERQLTDKAQMSTAAQKAQETQLKTELFRTIVNGGSVKDYDPLALASSPDAVKSMLEFESSWNRGNNESDPATYYQLSMMDGKQLNDLGPNIVDYASKLSKADLKGFIDKAGEFAKTGGLASRATDQTRTQIVTSAQNILGLDPNKRPADAVRMANLNRAFDTQIGGYIETNGKEPDGTVMQRMMDDLLLEGHVKKEWSRDPAARVFELTPEDRNNFYTAETIDDVPADARPVVAQGASSVWSLPPGQAVPEEMAVSFYNDYKVVQLGGAPTPPEAVSPRIAQGLANALKRMPTAEEVAAFYREWILKATAQGR